jgi:5-methylcytosine-specific restriction protein A
VYYVEGHHVLPMYQQKNYDFKIDDIDNIVSLCPNCHKKIHFADDKKEILSLLYSKCSKYLRYNSISENDLYKMYF